MTVIEQERETEVVIGTVKGVTQKRPDTWTVEVAPDGSQYSRNLWTKDVSLVQALQQRYLQQRLMFSCGISNWTNQQGQPVRSLWVNSVSEAPPAGAVQTLGQTGTPQQVLQQAQPQVVQMPTTAAPTSEVERETRIMRQAAAKCAVWMLGTLPAEERTFPHLVTIAEGWFLYFTHGREAFPTAAPAGPVQGTGQPLQLPVPGLTDQQMQQGQPIGQYSADDIPF